MSPIADDDRDETLIGTTIVTAHFNEDLSWLVARRREFKSLVVCSKTSAAEIVNHGDFDSINVIPNLGFEASAYLHYIVNNYWNLAVSELRCSNSSHYSCPRS